MGSEIKTEAAKLYPAEKIAHETHEKSKKNDLMPFPEFRGHEFEFGGCKPIPKKDNFWILQPPRFQNANIS